MGLLSKLGKALKKGLKKVVQNKVFGAVSTLIPGVGPVVKALSIASTVGGLAGGLARPTTLKAAAKAAVKKSVQSSVGKNLKAPAAAFGSYDNPLQFPVAGVFPTSGGMGMGGPMMGMAPLGRAIQTGGSMVMAGAGRLFSKAGRFLGITTASGKVIRRKQIVAAAKKFGLEATAAATGLTIVELSQLVIEETGKPRRARGITGSQLRNASSTIRRMKRFNQLIGLNCGPRRSPKRC